MMGYTNLQKQLQSLDLSGTVSKELEKTTHKVESMLKKLIGEKVGAKVNGDNLHHKLS